MNRIIRQRRRLLVTLTALLLAAFGAIIAVSYLVARGAIRDRIENRELPLAGDAINLEIRAEAMRPVVVSEQMANNRFLRDWIVAGERDRRTIHAYLREIRSHFQMSSAFFVSQRTHRYYDHAGIAKTIHPADDPADAWFERVRTSRRPYEINFAADTLRGRGVLTGYVNFRLVDEQGRFLGVVGVSVRSDRIIDRVRASSRQFQREVRLFDVSGEPAVRDPRTPTPIGRLQDLPGLGSIAATILSSGQTPVKLSYRDPTLGDLIHVNSRLMPDLGWYLVVMQNERQSMAGVGRALRWSIVIGALATLLTIGLVVLVVNRFQRRLGQMASTDRLTGVANRMSGDDLVRTVHAAAVDTGRAYSLLLIDCDRFKEVNDEHGHLAGDHVIAELAGLIQNNLRSSGHGREPGSARPVDIVVRWGGEEFLAILPNTDLAGAAHVAEALRRTVADHVFAVRTLSLRRTVSIGVAQWDGAEASEHLFHRADAALLRAKNDGRNRVTVDDATPVDGPTGAPVA